MHKSPLPVIVALALGFGMIWKPSAVATADGEYTTFLALHDELHPVDIEKREPHRVYVRKTFWSDDDRTLRVDAGTTRGKGALIIVEGVPGSDWLTAFGIASEYGATFALSVPEGEAVPCRVLVRSGAESAVASVANAPAACEAEAAPATYLLASL